IGENYQTSAKDIPNYVLKETPSNAQGTFSDQAQTVTYVYEKAEGEAVTVNYVDEDGKALADPETLTGKIGESYETAPKEIKDYVVKETPKNAKGTFSDQAQTVTYVYEKAEGEAVTINYVDEEGNALADPETLTGKIGESYETRPKEIKDYVVKETPKNAKGTFSDQAQTVTYVYEKVEGEAVTVNYVDEEGNALADPDTLTGKIGESYETASKEIKDYVVKETPKNAKGTFSDQAQTVTYVYEKAEGEAVTVNYVDEDGKALADPETLTGKIGESYETAPKEIKDYVVKETPKNAQGTFSDQAQTVTYVYEKNEGEALIINYVEKDKNSVPTKISNSHQSTPKTYPKTGENQNVSTLYSLSGITAVFLAAWVYLKRRLKNTKIDH
ncbi:MucBP domain-containing protein, partial [Enterococcus mundtii]|uniref:MucBP domain-containing protein n=1 Tax=Enterococcus mundtii TaxID=53346 RepID=UPI00232DB4CD